MSALTPGNDRANAILVPSGDQEGASSVAEPLFVTLRGVPPLLETTQMSVPFSYAIIVPSGEKAGEVPVSSAAPIVEPATVKTLIEPPWLTASLLPSADQAGSIAPLTSSETVWALSVVTV